MHFLSQDDEKKKLKARYKEEMFNRVKGTEYLYEHEYVLEINLHEQSIN